MKLEAPAGGSGTGPARPAGARARRTGPGRREGLRPGACGALARLAAGPAVVVLALDAGLLALARRSPATPLWPFAAAGALGAASVVLAFVSLAGRERRRQARLLAYARRYADAVRWDEQLKALHDASLEIARESAYPAVLQTIVDLASGLARARYGALAVFNADGGVEEFVTHGVGPGERERIGAPPRHRGLLAQLNGEGVVRLDDVGASPAFTGMPAGHPTFRTFLGVAVRWEGELLGHLYLGGHMGEQPFSPDEERLLAMFASEAGLAIARQRLYAAYARAVRSAERRRIAMGLHDRTLQGLYALALQLGRARRQGIVQLTDSMTVEAALAAVERSMASIRHLLDTLQGEEGAAGEEAADIVRAVEDTAAMCAVSVVWQGETALAALEPRVRSEVALCLCEAVTNAARHGRARRARITVGERPGPAGAPAALAFDVVDDGDGARAMTVSPGHGLAHIRARVRALGGDAEFVAREGGAGAGVHIRLPAVGGSEGGKGGDGGGRADSDR